MFLLVPQVKLRKRLDVARAYLGAPVRASHAVLRERPTMIGQNEISGNERFDLYGGHYGRLHGELAAELRCKVYGEDLGQTGWRTAAEQAEIAHIFVSGRTAMCSTSPAVLAARRWRWSSARDVRSPASTSSPTELKTPKPKLARACGPFHLCRRGLQREQAELAAAEAAREAGAAGGDPPGARARSSAGSSIS
jgi:hypothetical protein